MCLQAHRVRILSVVVVSKGAFVGGVVGEDNLHSGLGPNLVDGVNDVCFLAGGAEGLRLVRAVLSSDAVDEYLVGDGSCRVDDNVSLRCCDEK